MQEIQPNNPLHGVTLEQLLKQLVAYYGWEALGQKIEIRCFTHDPSYCVKPQISSSYPVGKGSCGIAVYRNGTRH